MDFRNCYAQGFVRLAARTLPIQLGDPMANAAALADDLRELSAQHVALAVYPELCLTGYSLDDLFGQTTLLDAAEAALETLRSTTADLFPIAVVGLPLRFEQRLFNCAAVLHRGQVLGFAVKSNLPNYREFYERRWFTPGARVCGTVRFGDQLVPIGSDLIFTATDVPDFNCYVEICEDMWVPTPPSGPAALAGATVIVNPSSSPSTIGRARRRKLLAASATTRTNTAYAFAAAGAGESSTDLAWDGQTFIYEAGDLLGESERFCAAATGTIADVDLQRLAYERRELGPCPADHQPAFRRVAFDLKPPSGDLGLRRLVARFPFVPDDADQLAQDCFEAFHIQVAGLTRRMSAIGTPQLIIGVSGGLDSTHALLVAAQAMDLLDRPRTEIRAYSLPGFATGEQTRRNAEQLARALGVRFETIDIRPAAEQLLADLDHPAAAGVAQYDITYENVQAGLRTDYLFRLANHHGGLVVGTGDLSELALGWCTYGVGDQMSHYAVNPGVPKTLIQHLIRWVISTAQFPSSVNAVLQAILDTEITPELIPTAPGAQPQSTAASIGPYELHDFTLFHLLSRGAPPHRIAYLAEQAWSDAGRGDWPPGYPASERSTYSLAEIRRWLEVFYRRFMTNQFKRSALPNGPKVSSGGALSPRGDWRMPSDASAALWLADLAEVPRS